MTKINVIDKIATSHIDNMKDVVDDMDNNIDVSADMVANMVMLLTW
jgi:hypothetical protein